MWIYWIYLKLHNLDESVQKHALWKLIKYHISHFIMKDGVKSLIREIHMYMIHSDTLCLWLSIIFIVYLSCLIVRMTRKVNPSHAEFF